MTQRAKEVTVLLTEEEARAAADWIMGHRPRAGEQLRTGVNLDRAVRKLRTAVEPASRRGEAA